MPVDEVDTPDSKTRWWRIVAILLAALLVPALTLSTWITLSGAHDDERTAQCIIVPGAKVQSNRELGLCLTARVQRAVQLYRQERAPAIIFTGGQGESGPIESECARDVAEQAGVPPSAIHVETVSHDTEGNFHQAALIMRQQGWSSCLVCSDPFHVRRCVQLAREEGLVPSPAPAFNSPTWHRPGLFCYYTLRECAAWVKYGLRHMGLYPHADGSVGLGMRKVDS